MFQVIAVLLSLFVGCWQSNGNLSLFTQVPDIINNLCPGSNVCSKNRSFNTSDEISFKPGTESCCAECSCLASCTTTGNCCYPNTLSSKEIFELNDFRNDHSCLYPMIPQPSADHYLFQSFIMVSSVHRPGTVDVLNVSCGDMNVAPWGSFYPIYSTKSKRIYKNKECAREDGADSDVILWDAVINCKDLKRDQGIIKVVTGLDTYSIPKSCEINFVFPGEHDVLQPHKCIINQIDTCTESRDFNVPEGINVSKDDLRTLCTDSNIVSPYRATEIYANVFCYICSGEKFSRGNVCDKFSGGLSGRDGNDGGFMALIDDKFTTGNRDTGDLRNPALPIACLIKEEDKCRPIFCPIGQLRDRTSKCVYPNKIWYNQNYAVYVNLTLYKPINVSEVFNFANGDYSTAMLPSLESVWLKRWVIGSIYFRVMDVPYMSTNLVIRIHRQLSKVNPATIMTNIKNMIGQKWSIHSGNTTELLISSNISKRTDFWRDQNEIKRMFNFYNLTEYVEIPMYKQAYAGVMTAQTPYLITNLYICEQIVLEPSEFSYSNALDMIYRYTTKRFMFDGQFTLVQSSIDGKYRARICIDDSGFYKRATIKNFGTILKPNVYCFAVATSHASI